MATNTIEYRPATMPEIQAAYDAWKDDPEKNYDSYRDLIVNSIYYYIQSRASHWLGHISGNEVEKADLIHDGIVKVLENLDKYDPYFKKGIKPATFFRNFIDDAMKTDTNRDKLQPAYYMYGELDLDRLAKSHGYTGLDDPRLDAATIIDLSGISPKKLLTIMNTKNMKVVGMGDDDGWLSSATSPSGNPEASVLNSETLEVFTEASKNLTPLERKVLYYTYLDIAPSPKDKNPYSVRNENSDRYVVAKLKKDKEFLEANGLTAKNITPQKVVTIRNIALMKLKGNRLVRSQGETREVVEIDDYSVIQDAIENGDLEDL